MNQIKELINDKDSVLVFDIDGVLAVMEWGVRNHFEINDEEWNKRCSREINPYNKDVVIKKMQQFISKKDISKIYVITVIGSDNEGIFKKEFVNKYYNIKKENVYCVKHNNEKIKKLIEIKNKYKNLEDKKIIMIDDTVDILNDIMEKTNFSTAHISSFFDI